VKDSTVKYPEYTTGVPGCALLSVPATQAGRIGAKPVILGELLVFAGGGMGGSAVHDY
jgi:hypothetical protein